jgi:hypothetical protein
MMCAVDATHPAEGREIILHCLPRTIIWCMTIAPGGPCTDFDGGGWWRLCGNTRVVGSEGAAAVLIDRP